MIPKLSIVFLNYNRLSETCYTLKYLKVLLKERDDVEIIAVDNGSSDGTREFLQTQTDWIQVVCLEKNLGIAGYNEGFRRAVGKYLLILDDDSHPVDHHTLDQMIYRLDTQRDIGVVACCIESPAGEVISSWHLPKNHVPEKCTAFVGCGFAIRRALFEKIGWYPGEFFLYQNEIEVAIRVRCQNYSIFYDPSCRVVHRCSPQGRSHWRRVYYPTRNTIWVIRRYFPFPEAAYLIMSRLILGFIRALQSRELGWYYQAVKEAFQRPIERQILSVPLRKELKTFWQHNSIIHHTLRLI